MSTKKSHRSREELLQQRDGLGSHSLMLELENAILKVEAAGFDEQTIYGFVNCILKGFITEGSWSPIYLQHVQEILRAKQANEVPAVIVNSNKLM